MSYGSSVDRQATPRPSRSSATSMPAVQEVQQQVEDFMATSLAMSDAGMYLEVKTLKLVFS